MKKILLIGSAGYIGTKLVMDFEKISEIKLCNIDIGWFSKNKTFEQLDYKYLSKNFVEKHDVVILLAGHSSVQMSEQNYESTFNNNVTNFINLCKILDNSKIKFIYASSASVYNDLNVLKYDENWKSDSINFKNPYDLTKSLLDKLINNFNIEYYGLRFGTVNGWSPHARNDVMLNAMTYHALNTGEIILLNPDTNRSILDIEDLSACIRAILNNKNDLRGIYNLSSFNITSEKAAEIVSQKTNSKIILKENTNKNYDFILNCEKFCNNFNFKFNGNAESITDGLIKNYKNIFFSNRKEKIKYV